jgi:DNA modification methylase
MELIEELLSGKRRYSLLQGNSLSLLKTLPDKIVQSVVTSPPYWGLRSYGTEPQLWGGDKDCEHQWLETMPRRLRTENDVKNPNSIQKGNTGSNHALHATKSCKLCKCWLGELGHEPFPEQFVDNLVEIFGEVRRVLRNDGVCWVNMGDSYHANTRQKPSNGAISRSGELPLHYRGKNLALVPQRLAIALQADGWFVRSEVIFHKKSAMPESVYDRPTRAHEQIWMLTKEPYYYYDADAIREPHSEVSLKRIKKPLQLSAYVEGRAVNTNGSESMERFCHPAGANKRDVWTLAPSQFEGEHYAGFPISLPELCIKASTSEKGRCAECSTAYIRDTERKSLERYELDPADERYRPERYDSKYDALKGSDGTGMRYVQVLDKGFVKNCQCKSNEILPCVVMDIFNGSGTTGLAAMQNGRSYIGLELNEEYVAMTKRRFDGNGGAILFGD